MDINQEDKDKVDVDKDSEMEEEKIDLTSVNELTKKPKKIEPYLIPTALYLITPDYYFTLPKLEDTLEKLTKEYYKQNCSLCNKITKRGAICLTCKDYI